MICYYYLFREIKNVYSFIAEIHFHARMKLNMIKTKITTLKIINRGPLFLFSLGGCLQSQTLKMPVLKDEHSLGWITKWVKCGTASGPLVVRWFISHLHEMCSTKAQYERMWWGLEVALAFLPNFNTLFWIWSIIKNLV